MDRSSISPREEVEKTAEEEQPEPEAKGVSNFVFGLLVLWVILDFISLSSTKFVLDKKYAAFPYPCFLMMLQMMLTTFLVGVVSMCPNRIMPASLQFTFPTNGLPAGFHALLVPVILSQVLGFLLYTQALSQVSFLATQTVKQLALPFVGLAGIFFRTEVFSPVGLLSTITIMLGVLMLSADHWSTWGNLYASIPLVFAQVCEAIRLTGTQYLLQQVGGRFNVNWLLVLLFLAPSCALICATVSFAWESNTALWTSLALLPLPTLLLQTISSMLSTMLSFYLVQHVSALNLLIFALGRDLMTLHLLEAHARPMLTINWLGGYAIVVVGLRSLYRSLQKPSGPVSQYEVTEQAAPGGKLDFFQFIAPKRRQRYFASMNTSRFSW